MSVGSGAFAAAFISLAALLVSSLLVYRAYPQRYLLVWCGGWALYLAHMAAGAQRDPGGLLSIAFLLGSQAVAAMAAGMAAGASVAVRFPVVIAAAALALDALVRALFPAGWGLAAGAAYLLLAVCGMAWALEYATRRSGTGAYTLAVAFAFRSVYFPEIVHGSLGSTLETFSALLSMVGMLVLALEAMRQHLRWSAAPGVIASLAADYTAPTRLGHPAPGSVQAGASGTFNTVRIGNDAPERIAAEIQRLYDASFSRFYLLSPAAGSRSATTEAPFLVSQLPRRAAGGPLCAALLVPEKSPEAASWLRQRGLRWAVVVPIPRTRGTEQVPTALFVLGYRNRRLLAPELMEALMVTARQFGVLLDNGLLLQQLSIAYRDWLQTVDAIGDLILVHDRDYRVQRVNRALADRTGSAPVDIVQRLCRDVLPRSPRAPWENCPFCEHAGGAETYDENFRGYFQVSTYTREQGDTVEVQHVVRDITERTQAEEKYRTMFEKVHEGVFVSSRAGRFLDFNDALARMLGYSREELAHLDIAATFVSPEERRQYLAAMDEQGYVRDYEVRLRRKNGEIMTGLETSFGTRDETGAIVQFQGFMLDLTARKRAEEELHEHVTRLSELNQLSEKLAESLDTAELSRVAAQELRRIFQADAVAGYRVDPAINRAVLMAAEGFGVGVPVTEGGLPVSEEFVNALRSDRRAVIPLAEMPPLSHQVSRLREMERLRVTVLLALRSEHLLGGFTLSWRSDRQLTPAEMGLLGAVGRHLNAVFENARLFEQTRQAYDELRRTQEQLLHSDKMAALGQLVSGVAHELNNPLTAIIGYAQLMSGAAGAPDAGYVEKLLRQARRTHRIIQNLLSFSRQHKPERRLLDVNQVIEDTLMLRDFEMQSGNVRVERRLGPDLPRVAGDVHQLEQVFLNIINNACDALRENGGGGVLDVTTYVEGQHVVAEFTDNGPGMREPLRVFDPFYTTKTVGQGTGLGLSICYGIIKEHGGEITAENRSDGGAAFRVRLPA